MAGLRCLARLTEGIHQTKLTLDAGVGGFLSEVMASDMQHQDRDHASEMKDRNRSI